MKKNFVRMSLFTLLCMSVLSFISCSSVPKKVGKDAGLVIMNVNFVANGYEYVQGKKTNVEVTLFNTKDGKTYNSYTNADKFVAFSVPGNFSYQVKQVKYTGASGESLWVDIPSSSWPSFKVETGKVTNLGYWKFDFDGTKNWCSWNRLDYNTTKSSFLKVATESEWSNKPIQNK